MKNESTKNVLTLISGTTIAQAIPIVAAPILTRIYSPEDFGVFALYLAITSIFSVMVTGRYELAIMLPSKDCEAAALVVLSIFVAFVMSILLFVGVLFLKNNIVDLIGNQSLSLWLFMMPVTIFLNGLYQSLNYWSNRKKKYRRLATNRVLQTSLMIGTQVSMGYGGLTQSGLIVGWIAGQGIATATLGYLVWVQDYHIFSRVKKFEIVELARRYSDFPKYLAVAHMLNSISGQSPNILLNTLFTSASAGFYMLTQRVISGPMSIVGKAIGDVFRQEASQGYAQNGECSLVFWRTLRQLVLFSILPFSIFFFLAPSLFAFVFGEAWRTAGTYAQILTPMFFFQFVTSPLSSMFFIAEKQKLDLAWQICLSFSTVGSLVLGYILGDVVHALVLFSLSYSIMYMVNIVMTFGFAKGIRA